MENNRFVKGLLLVVFLLLVDNAEAFRQRRQSNSPQEPEATFYQPPLLLATPQEPSPSKQGSYQPPIAQPRSNEYRSPLSAVQPSLHEHSSAQSYNVFPNQHQSVQYIPPSNPQQSLSILHRSQPSETSVSVSGGPAGISQSTAERTYSVNSKVVGSAAAQAIHKSPASEIEVNKGSVAKEKDNKNDEYVVYYYYYYDNDTSANNNLSLNFDDIPSLESYDEVKEPEKAASHSAPEGNAVDDSRQGRNASQARSVSGNEAVIRADKPLAQPLKPVSNVFRYGSNEVPRFPVLPNFIVSDVPTTTAESATVVEQTSDSPTTPPSPQFANSHISDDIEDDALNTVLDNGSDLKASEVKAAEEETVTTTTPEPTTTTEIPTTTTTEKPRRRPSLGGGGRRRFSPSPSPSFTSSRNRSPTRGSTTTTSTTTTTASSVPTRRSFQGSNRIRPRPGLGSRTGSRTTESSDDRPASRTTESSTVSTTTSRSRFTSAAPRRFQSSRSRSQVSSTSSTTRSPTSPSPPRSRPTSRPRPNLISRNRPPRPGFLRPRPGSEPEETETTTPTVEVVEETSPSGANEVLSVSTDDDDSEENEETSVDEPEEPTTTEANRFSALFRSRNRSALGNRPRPLIGNRPPRS